jgi:hypothetical protein
MEISAPIRWLTLCTPLLLFHGCLTFAGTPDPATRAVSEADLDGAIQRVEQLARDLETGPKTYSVHLHRALYKLGYGRNDPLFRTSLNGFEQDQIDLDDADEFKMGAFAFSLKRAGQALNPDPFDDWLDVQKLIEAFEPTLEQSRTVMARAGIIVLHSDRNIRLDAFQKLRKRWSAAVFQAMQAYEHAMAIRAVLFSDGEMVPAPQNFRLILDGGRYAVIEPGH